ncbi:MAG: c-type cytochrome [Bdellovibrionales bacterium]|nr:c-type cytochrome [Bdellovibrionales bacterium]
MKKTTICFLLLAFSLFGSTPSDSSRLVVHLLNYMASDYSGAVQNGKIVSPTEYGEQKEFSNIVIEISKREEPFKSSQVIQQGLQTLKSLILAKASSNLVRDVAKKVETEVLKVSQLELAPEKWPNLKHGKEIYSQQQCLQCHGVLGNGEGPSSGGLDPKPANFLSEKNDIISPFQRFNAIRLGVPGTAMAAFTALSDRDVWDLAFYIASLKHADNTADFSSGHPWTLEQVASSTDQELLKTQTQNSNSLLSSLSLARNYQVINDGKIDFLSITKTNLMASMVAFKIGNFELAKAKAIGAYLDGIEPLEPKLRLNDFEFTLKLEDKMGEFRSQIDERVSIEKLEITLTEVNSLLAEAKNILDTEVSSFWITFAVAAGIFLREALEAALILITLLSVVRTMAHPRAVYFIHGGWISAFTVGIICWVFSGWVVGISGLRRELLEGSISLFAVAILLYFGFWLHRKTEVGKWRVFINQLVKSALDNKKLFGLASVAFMGVFREAFETVLFLRAVSIESPGQEVALGLGVIASFSVVLLVATIALKYSARLPLRQLFSLSSFMMVFLAFILIGKSVHAFQEAGVITISRVGISFRIDWLGLFPTLENLVPQILLILIGTLIWLKPKLESLAKQTTTLRS